MQREHIIIYYIFHLGIDLTCVWDMFYLQLSKKDLGEYKATLKDERGQDVSVLEIAGKGKRKPLSSPKRSS